MIYQFGRCLVLVIFAEVVIETKYIEMHISSGGSVKSYFDGKSVNITLLNAATYSSMIYDDISVISIEIENNPLRNFIGSATDGSIETNRSWRCSSFVAMEKRNTWFLPLFVMNNSEWSPPKTKADKEQIANFSVGAKYIWPDDNSCCNAYCFYITGIQSKHRPSVWRKPSKNSRVNLIGQGDMKVFQDGAWVPLSKQNTNISMDNSQTFGLQFLDGLVDEKTEMLSILMDISDFRSQESDHITNQSRQCHGFTIFSDDGRVTTERLSDWKCADHVGATKHAASETWQWNNFDDFYWQKPVLTNLTIFERFLQNSSNSTVQKRDYFSKSKSNTSSVNKTLDGTFRWIWLDKRPWSNVIYCRYRLSKSLVQEHKSTSSAGAGGVEVIGDQRRDAPYSTEDNEIPENDFVTDSATAGTKAFLGDVEEMEYDPDQHTRFTTANTNFDPNLTREKQISVGSFQRILQETDKTSKNEFILKPMKNWENDLLINLKNLTNRIGAVSAYDNFVFQHGIELFVTAKDDLVLFVDGYQLPFHEGRPIEQAAHFILDPLSGVLAIRAVSFGERGILASSERNNLLYTDKRWLCTKNDPEMAWISADYDDSDWLPAFEITRNDAGKYDEVKLIRRDAMWIWARTDEDEDLIRNSNESSEVLSELGSSDGKYESVYCRFHLDLIDDEEQIHRHSQEGRSLWTSKCPS